MTVWCFDEGLCLLCVVQTLNFSEGFMRARGHARARVCMRCSGSVGQRNPLRQVMWVSNPLEGYRIPASAAHSLSALSKTSPGPRARPLSGQEAEWWRAPTMVHRTLALTHALPLRPHTQGPSVTATQSRCSPLCAYRYVGAGWTRTCSSRLGLWDHANKGSM